jgi:hypothetical protein
MQLERFNSGEEIDVSLSLADIYHWAACLEPHHQTGNRAQSQIIGVDLLNHVIYITAWQDTTPDEMAQHLSSVRGGALLLSGHLQAT